MILTPAKTGLNMKLARRAVAVLNALWLTCGLQSSQALLVFGFPWDSMPVQLVQFVQSEVEVLDMVFLGSKQFKKEVSRPWQLVKPNSIARCFCSSPIDPGVQSGDKEGTAGHFRRLHRTALRIYLSKTSSALRNVHRLSGYITCLDASEPRSFSDPLLFDCFD